MARTLEELNRTLAELGERQEKRRRLLAQWAVLREEADKRSARAEELKQVLAKERRDVEELEGMSLKGLWLRITGDREVRLSKEEAEALAAQAKYEQALRDVEDAKNRLAEMGRELDQAVEAAGKLHIFPDVTPQHWAYEDVLEAANAHLADCTGDMEIWAE